MTQAFIVLFTRGILLYWTKNTKMISRNAERAADLVMSFCDFQEVSSNHVAMLFAIECQAVLSKSTPMVMKREMLKGLIVKPPEDNVTPWIKELYFDMMKLGVVAGYAFAQNIAEGSEAPHEISAILSQARSSLEAIQTRSATSNRVGRELSGLAKSLLEVISSRNAEQSILAILPQLTRGFSAMSEGMGRPHSAIVNLKLLLPGGGIQKPEELRHLEKAMALARRNHDHEEASPLETFFAQAIQTSDYGAALLHHDRLRVLAQELPSLRLTSVTLQDGEGLRNFHMGRMLLDTAADRAPEERYTQLQQAEQHLREAVLILTDDIVSRMELHKTLVALANCAIMLSDNRGASIAYLLKAASLEYVPHPFSHSTTRNGCVIERMCREWLWSKTPDNFESQLTTSLVEQKINNKIVGPGGIKNFLEQCAPFLTDTSSTEPTLVLEEAQFLAVRPITVERNLQFWIENASGNWKINIAAIEATDAVEEEIRSEERVDTIAVRSYFASTIRNQGELDELEVIQEEVLETRRNMLGEWHADTITAIGDLATTLHDQGKWDEAARMKKEVLDRRRKILGEEHADTITAMDNVAVTLRAQCKAATMKKEVVRRRRKLFGDQHADAIAAISSHATTFYQQGKLEEAVAIEREVVEKRRKTLGEKHADTIEAINNLTVTMKAMDNLADTFLNQGKLEEAALMKREISEMRRNTLGEEHPDTITAISNLATILYDQGKLEEAAALEREVVGMRRKILGEEHVDTITAMNNLTVTLHAQGKLDEAATMMKEVLEGRRKMLGEEHVDTIPMMNNLANMLHAQGKLDEAAIMKKEVLERRRKLLGDEHADTIATISSLAVILYEQGKLEEAAVMEREVVEKRRKTLGEKHADTIEAIDNLTVTMDNLADTFQTQGKLEEAVMINREISEMTRNILGEEHPNTITAMNNLAFMLHCQGKLDEAAKMKKEVLERRRKILGEEHKNTITAMNNLTVTLHAQGKLDEAEKMQKEVLERRRKMLGEEHMDTITAINNLAVTLHDQGKLDEAAMMKKEVLESRIKILGEEHVDTNTAMDNLAVTLHT
jgi:tetratricopeptide (TPR) repeat protein